MPDSSSNIGKLYELLRTLAVPEERPRVWPTLLRRRRPLPRPMICLVTNDFEGGSPLPAIEAWLAGGHGRTVPRARVDVKQMRPDSVAIVEGEVREYELDGEQAKYPCLPILDKLANDISFCGSGMGPIRFPRYSTANWITRQRLRDAQADIAADELRSRLPRLLRSGSLTQPVQTLSGLVGGMVDKFIGALLSLWPVLRLWLFVSGVVPGLSRESRWFMNQRYLAPELSDDFLAFATRLTDPHRIRENSEQVSKLLVHAFLSDLRAAYTRRIWRPSSWRRTAYPVVLLDNVEEGLPDEGSPGANLLKWITEIRNETGLFDPLVVVARLNYAPYREELNELNALASHNDRPPLDEPRDGDERSDSEDALQRWQFEIADMRRNRFSYAWQLLFRWDAEASGPPPRINPGLARPPAPPMAARKWFVSLAVVVPLALSAVTAWATIPALRHPSCAQWPWTTGIAVEEHKNECIGYSADARRVFTSDDALITMQREVFAQNVIAEDRHQKDHRRRLISLIYFAGLTYSDDTKYSRGIVEELAGLAIQQRRFNDKQAPTDPLVRIIIANGGDGMGQATYVVQHMLKRLLHDDHGVFGVIGLDRSTVETQRAITELGDLGVPVVGTTLSADSLAKASNLYLQAVPSTATQAQLIADYVAGARIPDFGSEPGHRLFDRVLIYRPDSTGDIYVNGLVEDLGRELAKNRVDASVLSLADANTTADLSAHCKTNDVNRRTLLFFAGRNDDFATFTQNVAQQCTTETRPDVLAADTVTRLVADPDTMRNVPQGMTVRYVAKGAQAILGGKDCVQNQLDGTGRSGDFMDFCRGIKELAEKLNLPGAKPIYDPAWPGDRTAIAFDVVGLFASALGGSNKSLPSGDVPLDRRAAFLALRKDYSGITGHLNFAPDSQVASDAAIAILVSTGHDVPDRKLSCLLMHPRDLGNGCPDNTHDESEAWFVDH
ncbi:hypothetical protein GLP40_32565 [Nocardia sp. CT2-14]|uniref:ABC transporter substrate-binding protein n=1 Tax=Nocardia aurantiaca TaxID=2675850 RepID=A0A6I3LBG1_9NOCA|nr:hypothetical protein [Nocardia aurantiaca]